MTEKQDGRQGLESVEKRIGFELEHMRKGFYENAFDRQDLALASNSAANGRLIVILSFTLMLVLGAVVNPLYFLLALMPILSLCLAWLIDELRLTNLAPATAFFAVFPLFSIPVIGL